MNNICNFGGHLVTSPMCIGCLDKMLSKSLSKNRLMQIKDLFAYNTRGVAGCLACGNLTNACPSCFSNAIV